MDINEVKITQADIDRVIAQAAPAKPAGFVGDACQVYQECRSSIQIAVAILQYIYPPACQAIAAVTAILDKACEESARKGRKE